MKIEKLYRGRFSEKELKSKDVIWQTLCRYYFQKFIKQTDVVLDLGAGYCEFINNIKCKDKIAIEPNQDVSHYAEKSVKVFNVDCNKLDFISNDSVDVIFISNLLEHLESREEILQMLRESRRILKPGGIIILLQPNIRFSCREYWDFFDHKIPISDKGLKEALELVDFTLIRITPRFLPYTTKSVSSVSELIINVLIRIYLRLPLLWMILGKQMLIIAKK
ncbi:MAG: class I SAM-dependent methyltransferase [Candidatus Saelkia tenebricola]|nr:class I SAM-dependent methyltransferase [Candidatus Saelkia tenebricola]